MTGQQIEKQQQAPAPTLLTSLERMKPEIAKALPKHLTAERFARLVTTELRKNPKLMMATPESFFGALLTASALGLEPGVMGECYLAPYKDGKASREQRRDVYECQLIVGYQGLARLFWQHPLAKRLDTAYVCQNDEFSFSKGLNSHLHHVPAASDRGPVTHYYAIVELTTGAQAWEVLTASEVRVLRGGKVGTSGDIKDPQHWMERKVVLKQVMKLMPKSTTFAAAAQVDDLPGSMKQARVIAQQVDAPEPPVEVEQTPPDPQSAPPAEDVDEVTGEVFFPDGE